MTFNSLEEGYQALRYTLGHLKLFLKIAGPWSLVVGTYIWLVVHVVAYSNGMGRNFLEPIPIDKFGPPLAILVLVLGRQSLWLVAACAIAVAYHRAILENYVPKYPMAPLNGRWLRYFGKMVVAAIFVNQAANSLTNGDILHTRPLPGSVSAIVAWAFLAVASVAGLIFPATAINNRMMNVATSVVAVRRIPFLAYAGGFLLSSMPLIVAAEVLTYFHPFSIERVSSLFNLLTSIPATALSFAAVASNAIYMSRVYERFSPVHVSFPDTR